MSSRGVGKMREERKGVDKPIDAFNLSLSSGTCNSGRPWPE